MHRDTETMTHSTTLMKHSVELVSVPILIILSQTQMIGQPLRFHTASLLIFSLSVVYAPPSNKR